MQFFNDTIANSTTAACRRKERAPLWSGKRTVRTPIVRSPAILALKEQWEKKNYIDPKLYKEYNVKRGLRDEDGRGVLTGLTRVGEIQSYSVTEGEHIVPQDGMLYYRGIDCRELVKGSEGRRFAFEETAYLLLFGELPTAAQLEAFCQQLASYRRCWPWEGSFR